MTPFVFRLERVLRLRKAERQTIQVELGTVYGELNAVEAETSRVDELLRRARSSPARHLADAYRARLVQDLAALTSHEDELCRRAAVLLARLDRATSRVKALERLREKRERRHRLETGRREERNAGLGSRVRPQPFP